MHNKKAQARELIIPFSTQEEKENLLHPKKLKRRLPTWRKKTMLASVEGRMPRMRIQSVCRNLLGRV